MSERINQQWLLAARPEGNVKSSDFRFHRTPIEAPGDGEMLVRTQYLALAPVMRMYMLEGGGGPEAPLELGDVMHGRGVGQVIDSNHPDFATGDIVHGQIGWQAYKLTQATPQERFFKFNANDIPVSTALGVLGMTGFSAYCGLVTVGEPRAGDTVVVSGAAGGVGSIVVQLAGILGCRVIGMAGTAEKCAWLTDALGIDAAINYRSDDVAARLDEYCPGGIDLYFDNVGGEILDLCLLRLAWDARIVLCGSISEYLLDQPFGPKNYTWLGKKRGSMRGFFVYNHQDAFSEAEQAMAQWIREGKLKYTEDILEGFEQMPEGLHRLYAGKNRGKQLVRVDPEAR